ELVLRPREDGVEDLVRFAARPLQEAVDYLVDVRGVAGLRQVGNVVEFLDEGGAPRLRMEAPYVVGARGEVARGKVEVGCAHDEDERGPWGRAVVRPGVEECRVRVEWGGVEYPAVLDPVWTSTASLAQDRGNMPSVLLPSGRVLVAGGRACVSSACTTLDSTELFDPTTDTWSLVGNLPSPRDRFALLLLQGKACALGGDLGNSSSSDLLRFDEATGQWSALAPMNRVRANATAVVLQDKKTLAVFGGVDLQKPNNFDPVHGGTEPQIELYDGSTNTWSLAGALLQGRFWATSSLLADGRVLTAGGTKCSNCGPMPKAEVYDPVSKSSSPLPDMPTARLGHETVPIVVNGAPVQLAIGGGTPKSEYYDPAQNTWVPVGNMAENRAFFGTVQRPDGSILVAGGGNIPFFQAVQGVERLNLATLTWTKAVSMNTKRALMAYAQLNDGRVLMAGGIVGSVLAQGNTTNTVEVFQPSPTGEPCLFSGDCISGFCADGVCCATPCAGECEACSAAKKGSGADGQCGPVAKDTDPDDECAVQDTSTCGTSGACNGQGACTKYPVNTPCGTATCVDGVSTGLLCNAQNQCQSQVASCFPFLCGDTTACSTSCDNDLRCAQGAHCENGLCIGDKGQGSECERNTECSSGFCVDGVCCSEACAGTCQACKGSLKEGGGPDGVCGLARSGLDPHNDCEAEPEQSCDKNGLCDGKGSCALHDAGTPCQAPTCVSDVQGVRVASFACDGSGTCNPASSVSCQAFGCEAGACGSSCAIDADCAPGAFCDGGACFFLGELGASCKEGRGCQSGFCVDGVCCNSSCEGQCEACDVPKALGLCVPVSGPPHGEREVCPGGSDEAPCQQRTCDGVQRESCEGYVGLAVECSPPSCKDGTATLAGLCNGQGDCSKPLSVLCAPYICKGDGCGSECFSSADCADKFRCDQARGVCVPDNGAFCENEVTLVNDDGSTRSCAPYACEGSACKEQCSSVKDCALPNICDAVSRTCIPAQPNPSEEAGCHLASGPHRGALWPWALLLTALARPRRRRS
ncbi:MAG: hypothetical protein MUF64_27075, partial [Polyangiaceae bacterium]|nr:hypothetical protein [Polyangiaceae bacterium]